MGPLGKDQPEQNKNKNKRKETKKSVRAFHLVWAHFLMLFGLGTIGLFRALFLQRLALPDPPLSLRASRADLPSGCVSILLAHIQWVCVLYV